MYALAVVLTLLAIVAVVLRFWARRLTKSKVAWDDFFIVLALWVPFGEYLLSWSPKLILPKDVHHGYWSVHVRWCVYTLQFALQDLLIVSATAKGALGQHTKLDPETGYPIVDDRLEVTLHVSHQPRTMSSESYACSGCLCVATDTDFRIRLHQISCAVLLQKVKLTHYYSRKQSNSQSARFLIGRNLEICLWTMISVTIAWTIAFFFANLLQCLPLSVNWKLGYTPGACINEDQLYLAQGYSDIWTDGRP